MVKRIEVFSDEMGRYYIPAWERPKPEIGKGGFSKGSPEMIVYAAGYWPKTLRNKKDGRLGWGEAWKAEWDGEDIELEPMHWREWTKEEWEKKGKGRGAWGGWGAAVNYWRDCQWLEFPMNVVENIKYRIRKREMIEPYLDVCGDGMEYLRDARKQCGVDAFNLLGRYGLTKEEWEICLTGKGRRFLPDG